jgi:hypothetical protein
MALSRSVLEQQCGVRAGGLPLTVRGLNLHLATQNGMDIGDRYTATIGDRSQKTTRNR